MKHWPFGAILLLAVQSHADTRCVLHIGTSNGTDAELLTKTRLEELVRKHDVQEYCFTSRVLIKEGAIPHSHPVLTLHARHKDAPDRLLSLFLHEQIHWLEDSREEQFKNAMMKLKTIFPDAPVGFPLGAQSLESTYRHLIVNWLELQAMKRLIGTARARKVFAEPQVYKWVYAKVLAEEDEIGRVVRDCGLTIESGR